MKSKYFFPLLAAITVLAVGMVEAQIRETHIRADVPFAFTVGTEIFPAGQYTVRQISDLGSLAIVGGGSALAITQSLPVESSGPQRMTKLVFHRYGTRYFLYQVWVQGDNRGRQLPKTSLEKELASVRQPNSVAVLAQK